MSEQPRIVHGRMYENGPFYPRQYVPPGAEPMIDAPPLSDKEAAALREAFLRKAHGHPKVLGLPLRRTSCSSVSPERDGRRQARPRSTTTWRTIRPTARTARHPHCPPSATQDCDWPRCAGEQP